jgi:hypothetical protein
MLDCSFVDGAFDVTFENCDDLSISANGRICARVLQLALTHDCSDTLGFNLDIGDYRMQVRQGGVLVGVYKVRIYPNYN